MNNYSQNNEQEAILNYFAGKRNKTLLDIGANDGITFSNSYALITHFEWLGVLLEPSQTAFQRLKQTFPSASIIGTPQSKIIEQSLGKKVMEIVTPMENYPAPGFTPVLCNFGIANVEGESEFFNSGSFENELSTALVSTMSKNETARWSGKVGFETTKAYFHTFSSFLNLLGYVPDVRTEDFDAKFSFINIDAEGVDLDILRQIDLAAVECECLCIEHNGKRELLDAYSSYVVPNGMREIYRSPENIIFAK